MKTLKQMQRQPLKTAAGILLICLAVAVLCVCLGQSLAAEQTEQRLNETYQTAVFPGSGYTQEDDAWIHQLALEHPEIVQAVSDPGLASAYIPGLTPDNYTEHYHPSSYVDMSFQPYDCAMLEITLTEIGEPSTPVYAFWDEEIGWYNETPYQLGQVQVSLTGTVDRVIGLQEGYPDCLGFTARIALSLENAEALEDLELQVGGRYLVYSGSFRPSDYLLRSRLSHFLKLGELGQWHETEGITLYSEEEFRYNQMSSYDYVGKVRINGNITGIYQADAEDYRAVALSVMDRASYPSSSFHLLEDGTWKQELVPYLMEGEDGTLVEVTQEEYAAVYTQPTIVKLEGTAEEFLSSPEGALWQETLESIQVNNQAFPVIGVDNLYYLADFLRRNVQIEEGRDFTPEELEAGAKVCILSDTVAEKNGLTVGDTLEMWYYDNDAALPGNTAIGGGTLSANPQANYYFGDTTPLYQPETYTIIGIYSRSVDWQGAGDNIYTFTPNAIFVPKTAVTSEMEFGYAGFFRTLMLRNGTLEEFAALATEAGKTGQLNFFDNGYSTVEESVASYQVTAKRALGVGTAVYGIILLLFLLLYPGQQGRLLGIMDSLGVGRKGKIGHILLGAAGICIPGTVLGTCGGILMWQSVVDRLTLGIEGNLDIRLDIPSLVGIGLAQLVFTLVLVLLMALPLSGTRSLSKRK